MQNNKSKFRAVVLIVILIITSLMLVRFVLEFSQSTQNSVITSILLLPTDFLGMFFRYIKLGSIEISSIIGIIFFIVIGYISSKIITAIERENKDSVYLEILEAFLRALEFLIIFRAILKFIGASELNSAFVALIYFLTDWAGILLRPLNLTFGQLDISALIILAVVIALDINTEIILRAFKFIKTGSTKSLDFISKNTIQVAAEKINSKKTATDEKSATNTEIAAATVDVKPEPKPLSLTPEELQNIEASSKQVINIENSTVQIEQPAQEQILPKEPETQHFDDKAVPEG